MNQQLIPIIAAYWGAECSYIYYADRGIAGPADWVEINANSLIHITQCRLATFKLHLRPLWSVTEDELRELGEVLGLKDLVVSIYKHKKLLSYGAGLGYNYIVLYKKRQFWATTDETIIVKLINKLREWGFCVDQELVDAGIVEWKNN